MLWQDASTSPYSFCSASLSCDMCLEISAVVGVGIHNLVSKFLISVVRRELADGPLINLNCDILDSVCCEVGNVKLFVVCNINTFTC